MKGKRTVLGPAVVALVAVVSGGWLLQRGVAQQSGLFEQSRIFDEVLQYVSSRYVDEHPNSELYQMAVEGLLRELGDPHTSFMSAEEYNDLRIQTTGEYGGLGVEIDQRNGWITVISVLPDTPAEEAGLLAGDRIIEVEGESAQGWTSDDAVKVLRGPKGSPVDIQIARVGIGEPIPVRVIRDEIHVQSVPYSYMVDEGTGYIQLRVFSETAADEIRSAIDRLRASGMQRLIVDLRSNPGGLLDQGAAVTDLFLDRGAPIVETRSRGPEEDETYRAVRSEEYPGLMLAVLVNEYSASASEIVAGALQDNDRALVVGTPSFGKGSVQTLLPLSGGNFLKMTTGRWYTPVGRSIQKDHDRSRMGDAEELLEDEPITERGIPLTTPIDTASREEFRTAAGRVVYGGGGIVPDLILKPDTFTAAEQAFFAAASKAGIRYRDVLYQYATEHAQSRGDLAPDFKITAEMRNELFRRLATAGVELSREDFDAGREIVDRQLALQLATIKFGRETAKRREDAFDSIMQRTTELLRQAENQQALFQLAESEASAQANNTEAVGTQAARF